MEDAHVAALSLEENTGDKNTFFAVYDGHGGKLSAFSCGSSPHFYFYLFTGSTVARFAGEHVHKRLISEETYREKHYAEALKKAFLGTDEDLLAGASILSYCVCDFTYYNGGLQIRHIPVIRQAALRWQLY